MAVDNTEDVVNLKGHVTIPFSFGIDGDGNYGYYGADGSLIPFKNNDLEDRISKLESQIDEALYEVIEQKGTFNITSKGSQSWTKVGTFSKPFVELPSITFSLGGETGRITSGPSVSDLTLANVTVKFSSFSQGSSYSFSVTWHAVGKVLKS